MGSRCFTSKIYKHIGYFKQKKTSPLNKTSEISSYLGLLNITTTVRDTIATRVVQWRERPSSSGSSRQQHEHETQVLHDEGQRLITMKQVKLLSANISRSVPGASPYRELLSFILRASFLHIESFLSPANISRSVPGTSSFLRIEGLL